MAKSQTLNGLNSSLVLSEETMFTFLLLSFYTVSSSCSLPNLVVFSDFCESKREIEASLTDESKASNCKELIVLGVILMGIHKCIFAISLECFGSLWSLDSNHFAVSMMKYKRMIGS